MWEHVEWEREKLPNSDMLFKLVLQNLGTHLDGIAMQIFLISSSTKFVLMM